MLDLYDILGVPKDADDRAIKSAFRRMARLHHPDLNPGDERAQERFIELAAAFELLSDPTSRELYDEFGLESLREDFDPIRARWERRRNEDPFEHHTSDAARKQDETWAERFRREFTTQKDGFRSTFERAFDGFNNPFETSDETPFEEAFVEPGEDRREDIEIDLMTAIGGGAVTFTTLEGATLTIRIPEGIEDGEVLLVAGEGEPSLKGGKAGDLWLTVRITLDDLFERDGLDLSIKIPVTIAEAILGARVEVPTPHGSCMMNLPESVNSGTKLRLREMGVHRGDKKGDLYVIIEIKAPTFLDEEIKEAARTLSKGYTSDVRAHLKKKK